MLILNNKSPYPLRLKSCHIFILVYNVFWFLFQLRQVLPFFNKSSPVGLIGIPLGEVGGAREGGLFDVYFYLV